MLTVHKYPIPIDDNFTVDMPIGASILCVQMQHDEPQIWATVQTAHKKEARRFRLAGTGHPLPDGQMAYIGTIQLRGGSLVFHLFEVLP